MHVKQTRNRVLRLLLLVSLSACSGSGDTPTPSATAPPASPAEGLWTGTTNTNNRTVTGVVLDDGVYWFLYSSSGDPSLIAGVVQGDSSSQNGVLMSSNATDFSVERAIPLITLKATVDGTYTTKQSLDGKIVYQNNAQAQDAFTTTYNSDYESAPDINAVAGLIPDRSLQMKPCLSLYRPLETSSVTLLLVLLLLSAPSTVYSSHEHMEMYLM